jgi:5-formyltetrahydrofolate cyclo-ligase
VQHDQSSLRRDGIAARRRLTPSQRDAASEIIADKVTRAPWFQRSNYIACYLPAPAEVNTWTIISRAWRMKKRVFAPLIEKNRRMQFQEVTRESELILNDFGLHEPKDGEIVTARMLDVVLTPLVAFDDECHRIGMGGGYFDTTFAFLRNRQTAFRPKMIGLAFACQNVEEIVPNPWDIRLFSVVTENSAL